jgi:hypothetical protein
VLNLRSNIKLAELRAQPAFGAVSAAALPSTDDMPEELYPGVEAGDWSDGREVPDEPPTLEGEIIPPAAADGPASGGPSRAELVAATQAQARQLGWTDQGFKARIGALVGRKNLDECSESDLANLLSKMQEMEPAT